MFTFSQNYAADRLSLKFDYSGYTPPSMNLVFRENKQVFFGIPREDSDISLRDSYIQLGFNVTHRTGSHARYADVDHIRLDNLGPIALYKKFRLTSSSG